MPDQTKPNVEPRSFRRGEQGGRATATFSRSDREGRPAPAETAGDDRPAETTDPAAQGQPLKATDDPDSRDAPPPVAPREGGVR